MPTRAIKVWNQSASAWENVGIEAPAGGGSTVSYQAASPSSPTVGQIWVESDVDLTSFDLNQYLTQASASATYIADSIINAKGDLLVGSANDTAAILSVGANGHALLADSDATHGIKWGPVGKVLQIVRTTDTTQRTTTSTSLVDVTGMSVTITPQKNTSTILLIVAANVEAASSTNYANFAITDNSNNAVSGSESHFLGVATTQTPATFIAWATPATTSATTYKFRFRTDNVATTAKVRNDQATGQMFAIEVGA